MRTRLEPHLDQDTRNPKYVICFLSAGLEAFEDVLVGMFVIGRGYGYAPGAWKELRQGRGHKT